MLAAHREMFIQYLAVKMGEEKGIQWPKVQSDSCRF